MSITNLKAIRLISCLAEAEESTAYLKKQSTRVFIEDWKRQFENLIDGHTSWTFDVFHDPTGHDDNALIHFYQKEQGVDMVGYWVYIRTSDDSQVRLLNPNGWDWMSNIRQAAINRIFERVD